MIGFYPKFKGKITGSKICSANISQIHIVIHPIEMQGCTLLGIYYSGSSQKNAETKKSLAD